MRTMRDCRGALIPMIGTALSRPKSLAKSRRGANSFLQLVAVERRAVILKHQVRLAGNSSSTERSAVAMNRG